MRFPHQQNDNSVRGSQRTPGPSMLDGLTSTRRWLVVLSMLTATAAALAGEVPVASRLPYVTLIALIVAAGLGWLEWFLWLPASRSPNQERSEAGRNWALAIATAAVVSLIAVQSWFRWGTVIAGGDVTPPIGTAWISRIFTAWTWSGSNLGGPSALGVQLPWATVLGVLHMMGGSGELAQRVWYSGL